MDIEIHENTVRFTFKGINQIHCGIYRATLHEVGSNGELKTVDVCDIFELVPYTCQANLDDNDIIVDEVNLFSEITLGIYALTAQDKVDIANIVIDNATMQELIRKTITPYHASVYLPNDVPFTTALIPINTPTKIKLPTVIKTEHGFGVVDRGGASGYALQYQGTKPIKLRVFATTGINASVTNTTFNTFIYKNDMLEDGLGASAKLGTGTDVVTITSGGTMTVNPLDFIEIWISTNSQCRYTFSSEDYKDIETVNNYFKDFNKKSDSYFKKLNEVDVEITIEKLKEEEMLKCFKANGKSFKDIEDIGQLF